MVEQAIGSRPALWSDAAPRLNLAQWQKVSGWGGESLEAKTAEASLSDEWVLTLNIGSAAEQLVATPVPGVEVDYFGDPIPAQGARVGPFQRLTSGLNQLPLWPLPAK
jgi:hypothetical protein